jgi:hypothetical protein
MVVVAVAVATGASRSREESNLTLVDDIIDMAAVGLRERREGRFPVGAPVGMVDIQGVAVESEVIQLLNADVKECEIALGVDDGWLLGEDGSNAVGTEVGDLRRVCDDEGDLDFQNKTLFVVGIAAGGG